MKSYIEPLNAADALDVLDLYGIDTPGTFFSSEHEGCVEVELSGHTALLETPESVAMLFGHDAATALCQHSNFRRDAAEIMSRALDLDDFLYNVYSGTAFIPDKAPDGEFFGFHVAHIPLSAILEDDIDPLSPDACDYGLDSISETTEDAAVGYFDPAGAVDDEKFLTSADWALCDIESSVLTAFGAGCSPELAGWTLGNAESVAETCASLGVDIATAPAPDNPARVAAAAKAATKAPTHGWPPRPVTGCDRFSRARAEAGPHDYRSRPIGATMSTYKEQDIENLLAHLREGIASDSVLALADDIRVDCEGAGDGESVWMHPVLPGARYGKEDKVIYDPFDTLPGRSLKSSGGLPMVEFYLHRGDDRPDATRNVKDMEPAPYLIGRYYMKTLLADHLGRGILLQDMPRLALSADTVLDVQDDLAKAVRAYAAGCDFEIDGADADIARCLAQGGGCAAGTKVSAVYVPVGDLPRETTIFPDMARAAASIGLEDPETETLAEYGGVTVSLVRAADAEGSELKPNRAWARGGATEIVRGGFLVIATDGDGEVVDLPKWAIESAKTRFADPSTGPFQASSEFMREVRRGLGEQIEQAGRTPSDIAALASQLAAKPGDDGGAGGKRI